MKVLITSMLGPAAGCCKAANDNQAGPAPGRCRGSGSPGVSDQERFERALERELAGEKEV